MIQMDQSHARVFEWADEVHHQGLEGNSALNWLTPASQRVKSKDPVRGY